jgi:NAD(P)-dependent dehydrogenase (short-subunit alcohol dehydrogenase family)
MRTAGAWLMKRSPDVPPVDGPRTPIAMNPDEVARVAFLFATDVANWATGAVITVDAGQAVGVRVDPSLP